MRFVPGLWREGGGGVCVCAEVCCVMRSGEVLCKVCGGREVSVCVCAEVYVCGFFVGFFSPRFSPWGSFSVASCVELLV